MIEFIVPCNIDSDERAANKVKFLGHYRHHEVTLVENYTERSVAYNTAARQSNSEYIALADIDAIIPIQQINSALFMLENCDDMVYPYHHIINVHKDGTETDDWPKGYYFGCMVFFNRQKFLDFGGENEAFIGYGWEDLERYYRALNSGMRINRVQGNCYHMMHPRTGFDNPYFSHNMKLMKRERSEWQNSI